MECTSLSDKILDYINNRVKPKLETHDKNAEKERKKVDDPKVLAELEEELAEKRRKIEVKYVPENWLTSAAQRAKQIEFVTHPVKFSNTLIKDATSCLSLSGTQGPQFMSESGVVSTASLHCPELDVVGNAAALDVAGLLQLEYGGKSLLDSIQEQDSLPLQPFAANSEQLSEWMEGLGQALSRSHLSSHKYAKQLYFPIDGGKYHLLSPLFPSSLVQAIYERIADSRFSDSAKETRKAKKKSTFTDSVQVEFPGTAIQTHGGTKPQNVSLLNSRRNGRSFLLPCGPPEWTLLDKPPLKVKSIFTHYNFGRRVNREIWLLKSHVEKNLKKSGNVQFRNTRKDLLDIITDQLLQYGAEIQSLTSHAGWTALPECKLSLFEQLWLDPRRDDEAFVREREKNEWQAKIASEFAFWLNKRLKSKKFVLGDVEHSAWKDVLEKKLKLFKEDLEVFA